jgi:hypothetical protein
MSRRELPATATRVAFLDNEAAMLGIIFLFALPPSACEFQHEKLINSKSVYITNFCVDYFCIAQNTKRFEA